MVVNLYAATHARRRRVRVRCSVTIGDRTLDGFTRNLSESGGYLLLRPEESEQVWVGRALRLRIDLPGGKLVDCPAEIAWLDVNDRDVDGRPVLGIGAKVQIADARHGDQLREFIHRFRYVVVVAGGSDVERGRITGPLMHEYDVVTARERDDVYYCLDHREVAVLVLAPTADSSSVDLLEHVTAKYPRSHAVRLVLSNSSTVGELRALINHCEVFRSLDVDVDVTTLLGAVRAAADRYALAAENERMAGELERTKRWLERENAFLRQRLTGAGGFDKIIGKSDQLRDALGQLERIRRTHVPVHVLGETGTGKELVARALHAGGPRADRPYVVQNCAGMTDTLLQSTLFGHRKGAFTGADRDHRGVFLEADGGTLFLDEVGELSPATQGMLLRALENGEVTPVGASRPIKVDTRILSATHKDLREEVNAGRFREDLLYRLLVVTVRLPPLRERQGDIALLARHFLDAHCERYGKNVPGFRPDAVAALEAYPWPGNVRELDNEVERIVILTDDSEKIALDMLSPHIVNGQPVSRLGNHSRENPVLDLHELSYDIAIERLERTLIERAMAAEGGSITKAAKRIGIERSRLGKIRKRLGI